MDKLKTEMEQVDKQFVGNKMQDANEFLCRLIDSMKDNINLIFRYFYEDFIFLLV